MLKPGNSCKSLEKTKKNYKCNKKTLYRLSCRYYGDGDGGGGRGCSGGHYGEMSAERQTGEQLSNS